MHMKFLLTVSAIIATVFLSAQSLNTTFANQGVLIEDIDNSNQYATAITTIRSGNVLVVGTTEASYLIGEQIFIHQYLANGKPDVGFGKSGKVIIPIAEQITVTKIVQLFDNKIIIGGNANHLNEKSEFFLIQLLSNGELDLTFGNKGITRSAFNAKYDSTAKNYIMRDFDIDFFNNIITVGESNISSKDKIAIAKFTAKGKLATDFFYDGMYVGAFPITNNSNGNIKATSAATKVIAMGDGSYLIGGTIWSGGTAYDNFVIQKILNDGKPDESFNSGNPLQVGFDGAWDELEDIMMTANGNFIGAGTTRVNDEDFACFAVNQKGYLDYSVFGDESKKYGPTGKTQTGFSKKSDQRLINSVMLPDGKFILIGTGNNSERVLLAKYLANGKPDESFGENGKMVYLPENFASDDFFDIHDVALGNDGALFICGWISKKNSIANSDIFVVSIQIN
jgi:uncharacterized delta-60 repeat protein